MVSQEQIAIKCKDIISELSLDYLSLEEQEEIIAEMSEVVYEKIIIYESVWKGAPLGAENTVAVHIRHLREKLEIDPETPRYLKVVWGQGYKMETEK